jgi:uncharacterized protein YaiI (UPF0178 family)
MRLIVDGDACPVKDLILRTALRLQVPLLLVSNKPMAFGREPGVTAVIVPAGPDEADRWIADTVTPEDLVITADIPLAAAVVAKGAVAVGHRGELFDEANIKERMAMWALHRSLREEGLEVGGPKSFAQQDRSKFSATFDRQLNLLLRRRP